MPVRGHHMAGRNGWPGDCGALRPKCTRSPCQPGAQVLMAPLQKFEQVFAQAADTPVFKKAGIESRAMIVEDVKLLIATYVALFESGRAGNR